MSKYVHRERTQWRIIGMLAAGGSNFAAIRRALKLSTGNLSYHLNKLIKDGIV